MEGAIKRLCDWKFFHENLFRKKNAYNLCEAWDNINNVRGCLIAFLAKNDLVIYQYTK